MDAKGRGRETRPRDFRCQLVSRYLPSLLETHAVDPLEQVDSSSSATYSPRNVTLGSSRLARRPGIATAAIAETANISSAAASTGTDAATAW